MGSEPSDIPANPRSGITNNAGMELWLFVQQWANKHKLTQLEVAHILLVTLTLRVTVAKDDELLATLAPAAACIKERAIHDLREYLLQRSAMHTAPVSITSEEIREVKSEDTP